MAWTQHYSNSLFLYNTYPFPVLPYISLPTRAEEHHTDPAIKDIYNRNVALVFIKNVSWQILSSCIIWYMSG